MKDYDYSYFEKILKEKNLKPIDVSRNTGIATSTISDWKAGRTTPKEDKMRKISKYLQVSMGKLRTGEDDFWEYIGISDPRTNTKDDTILNILENAYAPGPNDKALKLYEKYINAEPHIRDAIDKLLGMESE